MPLQQTYGHMLFEWQTQSTITYLYEGEKNHPSNYLVQR
jgi:hypothetical protein